MAHGRQGKLLNLSSYDYELARKEQSKASRNFRHTPETKKLLSELASDGSRKGKNNPMYGTKRTGNSNGNARKVVLIENGKKKINFGSIKEAANHFGLVATGLATQIRKGQRHHGLKFIYEETTNSIIQK